MVNLMRTKSAALCCRFKIASLIFVGTMLVACISMTDPVEVGQDTYMMGLGARGGLSSDAELLSQTIKAAVDFCAAKNRRIEVQNTSTTGVQMWTPQNNEVTFKCFPLK
jgi:hypothetical protein